MNKALIIKEIQRTARENGSVPLGMGRFHQATGIKRTDWLGKYWARWGDAVREAGFSPNTLQVPYGEADLLEKYIALTRERGRFPVKAELQLQAKKDSAFPAQSTFFNRFGANSNLVARLSQYCEGRSGYEDIVKLCASAPQSDKGESFGDAQLEPIGYVYLVKHGSRREYKIGKTFNPVRREGEIALQLPEKLVPIHYIKTDDPSGIEKYWHSRFSGQRKEGEWFALTAADVQAFKKWRRIY